MGLNVGVIGMGYVGIPSAIIYATSPEIKKVYGFQRNSPSSGHKIDMLNHGILPMRGDEPELEGLLNEVIESGKFKCTSEFSKLANCDVITIDVQTPFDNKLCEPDYGAINDALSEIGIRLQKGALVIIESTVNPNFTKYHAKSILEILSGYTAGKEFYLAHAPERVMVGRLVQNIKEHYRIVGGVDPVSTQKAVEFYSKIIPKSHIISMDSTAAEVTKTAENAVRDLQIATSNYLALYCESIGINFYDVFKGIDSLQGYRITRGMLLPGAGVGGHCLTKDSYHLECACCEDSVPEERSDFFDVTFGSMEEYEITSPFVNARNINDFMPQHMYNLTVAALERIDKHPSHNQIAILGWSFIKNSGDTRNSPAMNYYRMLSGENTIKIHESHVDETAEIFHNLEDVLDNANIIAIFTDHDIYHNLLKDPNIIKNCTKQQHPIIIDGRNVINPDSYIEAGFVYKGIGRGDKNYHQIKSG